MTADQARAGDEAAVQAGATWVGLMRLAARSLANEVLRAAGGGYGRRVVVVVGKGNNGGDGWAAAGMLADRGAAVTVVSMVPVDVVMSDEAMGFRDAWVRRGGRVGVGLDDLAAALDDRHATGGPDVVVDCLLGTGATGAPRGDVAAAVEVINQARGRGTTVVACDMPTGVEADSGRVHDPAVQAEVTVTFGAHKRGLVLAPGSWQAGRVVRGELGATWDAATTWFALTAAGAAPTPRVPGADKVAAGRVLVVGGSVGTGGAAVLATRGAVGAGAGLTTLATSAPVQRVLVPAVPAAMTRRLRHGGEHVAPAAVDDLQDTAAFDAVVAGPGLGPVAGTRAVADHLLGSATRLVLDADAINVFRDDPAGLASHAGDLVLTPHERELARLGGGDDGADAWDRRVERVPELAVELDATIVAKGPATLVAAPDGRVWVTPVGGPELGIGGTGDVLAGMVAAAIAPPAVTDVPAAVAAAVWRHSFAGHRIATTRGLARLTPDELAASLPDADADLVRRAERDPLWPFVGP